MHTSVMKKEIMKCLNPQSNEDFVDGTLGDGGHSLEILKLNGPNGKVLGIDWDKGGIERMSKQNVDRLITVCGNYKNVTEICEQNNIWKVSGAVLDLGLSMRHIKESNRGFTFKRREKLDMRYSTESELSAQDVVNTWSEEEIEQVLREYGEERFSREIASEIVKRRKEEAIESTEDLVKIIKSATPLWYQKGKISPATRTFQALRIVVNRELENLTEALPHFLNILEDGGRLCIISYHSLEDRIVKQFLRLMLREGRISVQSKKPIRASEEEIKKNPSARSALLRSAVKIN